MVVRILRRMFGGTIPNLGISTNKRKETEVVQLVVKKPRYDQLFPSSFAQLRQLGQQVVQIRQDYQHPKVDNSMDKVDQILSLLLNVQSEISLLNVKQQVLTIPSLAKDNQVTQTCTTGQCTVDNGTKQIQQVLKNVPTLVNGTYDNEIAELRAELKLLKQTLSQLSASITTGQAVGLPGAPIVIDTTKKTLANYEFFGKLLFDPTIPIPQELQDENLAYVNLEKNRKASQTGDQKAQQLFQNQLNLINEQLAKDIEKLPAGAIPVTNVADVAKAQLDDLKKNRDNQKDLEAAYNKLKELYYDSANPLGETDEWKAASQRRLKLNPLTALFPIGENPDSTDPKFSDKIEKIQKTFDGTILGLDPTGLSLQELQAVLFLLIQANFDPRNQKNKYDKTVEFIQALDKAKINPPKINIKNWTRDANTRFKPPVAKPKEIKKDTPFVPKSKRPPPIQPEITTLEVIPSEAISQDLNQTVAASSVGPGKAPPLPGKAPPPPGKAPSKKAAAPPNMKDILAGLSNAKLKSTGKNLTT